MPRTAATTARFSAATFEFLAQLASSNNRAWFAANKERYDEHVVAPALAFIDAMAPRLAKISKRFVASPKRVGGSLIRIYRDARFARDQAPYKTNVGIQFRHERGRDVHAPSFYLHVEPGSCFLGAGIWHPEPPELLAIRRQIIEEPKAWGQLRDDPRLRRHFALGGASLAKPPRGFPADAPHIEDLQRKDYIVVCTLPDRAVLRPRFADDVAARLMTTRRLMAFLCGALDLPF